MIKTERGFYIEEELEIDRFCLRAGGIRKVQPHLKIEEGCLIERGHIELLEPRDVHRADIPFAQQLLLPLQHLPQELHAAFVVCREMELTLNSQDRVEVVLLLDEVAEVAGDHFGYAGAVCLGPESRVGRGLLFLVLLQILIDDVVRQVGAASLAWKEIAAVVEVHAPK